MSALRTLDIYLILHQMSAFWTVAIHMILYLDTGIHLILYLDKIILDTIIFYVILLVRL